MIVRFFHDMSLRRGESPCWATNMDKFLGKEARVTGFTKDGSLKLAMVDGSGFNIDYYKFNENWVTFVRK